MRKSIIALCAGAMSLGASATVSFQLTPEQQAIVQGSIMATIGPHDAVGQPSVSRVVVTDDSVVAELTSNYELVSFTPADVNRIKKSLSDVLSSTSYRGKKIGLSLNGHPIEDYFVDYRKIRQRGKKPRFVTEVDPNRRYNKGLDGNIVALWQSHGWYYESAINHWTWQRPRLFQTVEDLFPCSFVSQFLMPMLENAGCYVWNPRERDWHTSEYIVDGDGGLAQAGYAESDGNETWTDAGAGFIYSQKTYKDWDNPFAMGHARQVNATASSRGQASASWSVNVDDDGDYAVYISYKTVPNSVDDAHYTVNSAGKSRSFIVNQRMAGGVWVYLGTFPLKKGMNPNVVVLTNQSRCRGGVVTADAIKVGGGMGNIARTAARRTPENVERGKHVGRSYTLARDGVDYRYMTSGYPRFAEGSRYFLQWSGFPDSVYSVTHGISDYADDFRSRSEWVNYLAGGSDAITGQEHGLRVPLDLSFAFHTDAGVTPNSRIFGTNGIYRSNDFGHYADGTPRIISRDLCQKVSDQIVNDIRAQFEPEWTNRGMTQENLYEIRVPQIPGMLMELLSHQNFADMRYGLDPNFRFTVSRAMYKGILRYIAARDHRQCVVTPLAVNSFAIKPDSLRSGVFELLWRPTVDTLEATAVPRKYIVLERKGNSNAFDEIATTEETQFKVEITDTLVHSYRVVAMNDGGRSFPSQTLSLGVAPHSKGTVLVVNDFTRLSAPDWIDNGNWAGFLDSRDHGVPYMRDITYVGPQYEHRRSVKWRGDDSGGWGASHGNYEGKVIAGNTFDYPAVHGSSIMKAGYSFVSASVEAVENGDVDMASYKIVDVIAGKQKSTPNGRGYYPSRYAVFSKPLIKAITAATQAGTSFMVTGSYVASDANADTINGGKQLASDVLGYRLGDSQAAITGKAYSQATQYSALAPLQNIDFSHTLNDSVYCVESPDAVYRAGDGSTIFMRYSENNKAAGIVNDQPGYRTAVIGFPFEAILWQDARDALMQSLLAFLSRQ